MGDISKRNVTRYWKYQQWTQPAFSSHMTWGYVKASSENSSYYAWRALDGVIPQGENYGNTWETANVTTGWWQWAFQEPLRLKSFTIYGRAYPDSSSCSYGYTIKTLDQTITLAEVPYQEVAGVKYWTFTLPTPIICNGLYITKTSSDGYSGIGELQLNADLIIEGSESDYDYTTEGSDYYINEDSEPEYERHYYKYVDEEKVTGTFPQGPAQGKVSFITGASYYTIAQSSTIVISNGNTITLDLGDNAVNIRNIGYIGVVVSGQYPGTVLSNIQCSEDNVTWDTISSRYGGRGDYLTTPLNIPTPNNYRYIRFTTYCDDPGFGSFGGMHSLRIGYTATEVKEVSEDDDYDYYIDVEIGKGLRYYKYKPFLQPTFSSNFYYKNNRYIEYNLYASHESGPAWYAFNKSLSGDNCWWTAHGQTSVSNPCWITFHSPHKLKMDRVTIMNENTSPANFKHAYIQGSNDNINWTSIDEIWGQDVTAKTMSFDFAIDTNYYHYYRLYFDDSYNTSGISIQIINYEGWIAEEVTSEDDYDFTEDEIKYITDGKEDFFYKYDENLKPIESTRDDYIFYRRRKHPAFYAKEQ